MLRLAISAQLPIIAVASRDTLNFTEVLKELTDRKIVTFDPNQPPIKKSVSVCFPGESSAAFPWNKLYEKFAQSESSLIVVNPGKVVEPMFDAGEAPVPRALMMRFIKEIVEDDKKAEALMRGLGGCTIKEAAELARLTMARDTSLTVKGVMETRKSSFQGAGGLSQVDARQNFYDPPKTLVDWVVREKQFFLTGTDFRLIPRGLLLDGPSGTGKTSGAKWIAEQFGVPLFRVDIGGTKNKYVGESERNMLTNLARLDHEEPCVALMDEVEKVFAVTNNDSTGTTSTMLSQLLWWLAERRSRVLVVLTTNNAKALPKELYREGRVDEVMWFGGLEGKQEAMQFAQRVLATFDINEGLAKQWANKIVIDLFGAAGKFIAAETAKSVSQAAITKAVYQTVKLMSKNA